MRMSSEVMSISLSNLRDAPAVDAQAEVNLTTWRVFRAASGDDYLFGFHNAGQTLRVTTPVRNFDTAAGVVVTASGRRYLLSGPPVVDAEILAAMAVYAMQCSLVLDVDVTGEYWSGAGGWLQ